MNAHRVDFIIDLIFGGLLAVAIVMIAFVGTDVGIAFGVGVLAAYVVHVSWKMARFDPEWMTESVAESVEETLSEEIDEVIDKVDEVNERVERRPRADEVEEIIEQTPAGE